MKLYCVQFDGQPDFVEAENFGVAIAIWRKHLIAQNEPGDFDDDVEPESLSVVSEEPVLRGEDSAWQVIDIVFDGPPGPESGRFIEVEKLDGKGVKTGEWIERMDGYHVLRLTAKV